MKVPHSCLQGLQVSARGPLWSELRVSVHVHVVECPAVTNVVGWFWSPHQFGLGNESLFDLKADICSHDMGEILRAFHC